MTPTVTTAVITMRIVIPPVTPPITATDRPPSDVIVVVVVIVLAAVGIYTCSRSCIGGYGRYQHGTNVQTFNLKKYRSFKWI